MIARILRPDEWKRLEPTQLPPLLPFLSPESAAIVVVEHGEKIVASMAVLQATHFEGAWIDPAHRNAGVTRALLRLASALARVRGEQWVFGGAADGRMEGIMGRLNAIPVRMDLYAMWIGGEECRPS